MDKEKWIYYLIRTLMYPLSFIPYPVLRLLGKGLGIFAFYTMTQFRKRALSNLALADDLHLKEKELFFYAKKSFQNLAINCLEYPKFSRKKNLTSAIKCENPEEANRLYEKGQGIIFFCAHQSNWEALFLDGTTRMKGIAIGKPIKNKRLYDWIISIREKNGGKIIAPRSAVKESIRALRKGSFIGIVGDQGMPGSGYSFPFFGRRAWTSTAPALLAYKTNSPIIFASTKRTSNGYTIHYSDPIWPNLKESSEKDVVRMMNETLTLLQESIKESPGEWFWQHNRWKQQTIRTLVRRFRQDCVCIILPEKGFENFLPALQTLKKIYQPDFLFLLIPKVYQNSPLVEADEIIYYTSLEETLIKDYRFKLVFNFTDYRTIHKFYEKLSVLEVLDLATIQELAKAHLRPYHNLSDTIERAICRPNSIWKNEEQVYAS